MVIIVRDLAVFDPSRDLQGVEPAYGDGANVILLSVTEADAPSVSPVIDIAEVPIDFAGVSFRVYNPLGGSPPASEAKISWFRGGDSVPFKTLIVPYPAGVPEVDYSSSLSKLSDGSELRPGNYRVEWFKEDRVLPPISFTVVDSSLTGDALVRIASTPSGAAIFVDNVDSLLLTPQDMDLPVGNHSIRLVMPGFQDWTSVFDLTHAGRLLTAALIPGKGSFPFPDAPPGEYNAFFYEQYDLLKQAYEDNNAIEVMRLLKDNLLKTGSGGWTTIVLSIAAVASLVVGIVQSYTMAKFLGEEAAQELGMAWYAATNADRPDLAEAALDRADEFYDPSFTDDLLAAIPIINAGAAAKEFMSVNKANMEIRRAITEDQMVALRGPVDGDYDAYLASVELGSPNPDYLPPPDLPKQQTGEFWDFKNSLETRYWAVKSYITSNQSDLAQGELELFKASILELIDWSTANVSMLAATQTLGRVTTDIENAQTQSAALQAEIDALPGGPSEVAHFNITANVIGAKVYFNGEQKGLTPLEIDVLPDTYTILLQKFGYNDESVQVTAEGGQTYNSPFFLVETESGDDTGTLQISANVSDANVWINGAFEGKTTYSQVWPVGDYNVLVSKTGYLSFEDSISITANQITSVTATLLETGGEDPEDPPDDPPAGDQPETEVVIPLTPSGEQAPNAWKVTIRAIDSNTNEPLNAQILIDDVAIGNFTPWYVYLLPEETYNIKLRRSGYEQGEINFTTEPLPTQ